MPVTHASRTGKTYFLHSGPKRDGGVQHFFSTKPTGNLADRLPEGFEIYEAAWTIGFPSGRQNPSIKSPRSISSTSVGDSYLNCIEPLNYFHRKNYYMSEFHLIWKAQCEAAEGIHERFGPQDATRYLIGEKLLRFMEASGDHPEFSAEMPKCVAGIKDIFSRGESEEFFQDAESGRAPDPVKMFNGGKPQSGELDEGGVIYDAEKILLIENAKWLLLPELR